MNIFGTVFNYQKRLEKVRKLMNDQDLDCMVVLQWTNQYYLSGFYQHLPWYPDCHSSAAQAPLIVFRDEAKEPVFLCAQITYNAVKEGTWIRDVRAFDRGMKLNVHQAIAAVLKEKGVEAGKIGLEDECCTINTFRKLREVLPKAQFKDTSHLLYLARVVKEPEEIELIKKAVSICETAIGVAKEAAQPGVPESEVQKVLEIEVKKGGGIREVESMCQSGIRTANYRAFASEMKKIANNELVMVDLGCVYKGYGCDITRVWVVGQATDEQRKVAADMYKQHEKILGFIKPGLTYREVEEFALGEFRRSGYSTDNNAFPFERFSMHGIGLGPFHELPENTHKDMVLESGMTMAIQPGVRYETYSIRFEDNAVITPDGLELLTTFPREFI